MNNTERGTILRAILSSEITNYEREAMSMLIEQNARNITHLVDNLEENGKTLKMLQAIKYLLTTINE